MKITANFSPLPAGLNQGRLFTRSQMDFVSLDGSDMYIRNQDGINGLYLNTGGMRIDFILPTDIIYMSLGTWAGKQLELTTIDTAGTRLIHTIVCDHAFTLATITDPDIIAIEFATPQAESLLEFISIEVNFC
jgi:hypothetical protein